MAKVDQAAPKKDEPVAVSNHTEKIKSQVLEKVGRPPRLHRVEVCRHHDGNYRVNIWEQLEPMGDSALSMCDYRPPHPVVLLFEGIGYR
jgi:hypothetical protein